MAHYLTKRDIFLVELQEDSSAKKTKGYKEYKSVAWAFRKQVSMNQVYR